MLKMKIYNFKSISSLEIDFPTEKGIYAITGENGSGKSTLIAGMSLSFFNAPWKFFGRRMKSESSVDFEYGTKHKSWAYHIAPKKEWKRNGSLNIKGFYEGSVFYGNRFRKTLLESEDNADSINLGALIPADPFIKDNLGLVLHNDRNRFKDLVTLPNEEIRDDALNQRPPFFNRKNGLLISSYNMSTGENLLLTILYSLWLRIKDRNNLGIPYLLLLDEIELALHPSALSRLMDLLKSISIQFNMAVYFSTHSLELISGINPQNIFFLDRLHNGELDIVNPCYPAYATKILYDHSGYDTVIMVEDDLAKIVVSRLIRDLRLMDNKLIHVMPCGDWRNVIKLANDVVENNLLSKTSKVVILLDRDISNSVPQFMQRNNYSFSIPVDYIPMNSLEKFLLARLVKAVDTKLYRFINDYLFQKVSLGSIIEAYKNSPKSNDDKNGKEFFKFIESALRDRKKSREDIVEIIVDHLFATNDEYVVACKQFLESKI